MSTINCSIQDNDFYDNDLILNDAAKYTFIIVTIVMTQHITLQILSQYAKYGQIKAAILSTKESLHESKERPEKCIGKRSDGQ